MAPGHSDCSSRSAAPTQARTSRRQPWSCSGRERSSTGAGRDGERARRTAPGGCRSPDPRHGCNGSRRRRRRASASCISVVLLPWVEREAGHTVNDRLVASLHLAIQEWNASRQAPCEHISVMMPVNQRRPTSGASGSACAGAGRRSRPTLPTRSVGCSSPHSCRCGETSAHVETVDAPRCELDVERDRAGERMPDR